MPPQTAGGIVQQKHVRRVLRGYSTTKKCKKGVYSTTDVVNSIAIVIEQLLNFSSIVTIDIAIEPQ